MISPLQNFNAANIFDSSLALKTDPPLNAVTTARLHRFIMNVLGLRDSVLKELTDPLQKDLVWGILYVLYRNKLVAGEFGTDFIWNEQKNQAEPIVNPDVFIPNYRSGFTPYGEKLRKFNLGLLDIGLPEKEILESLNEVLNIPADQKKVNWWGYLKPFQKDIQAFRDRFPYFKLAINFLLHPYIFTTDATGLGFFEFSALLNKALGLSYERKTAILRIPQEAMTLHEIDNVPNYDLTDGKNTIRIVISRSSGVCEKHQKLYPSLYKV